MSSIKIKEVSDWNSVYFIGTVRGLSKAIELKLNDTKLKKFIIKFKKPNMKEDEIDLHEYEFRKYVFGQEEKTDSFGITIYTERYKLYTWQDVYEILMNDKIVLKEFNESYPKKGETYVFEIKFKDVEIESSEELLKECSESRVLL